MKTIIIAIAAAAVLSLAATPAMAQDCLTDGRILTMKGTVVDKAFTDYDKGQAFQHHYTALLFDRPRCVDTEFGSGPAEMFEQFGYLDGDTQLVGHRVITKVQVSKAGGTIHYPTSVVLFPLDVRIMKAPTRTCSIIFDEKHPITLHGMIVQSATTEEEEGEPPHKYLAIVMDHPICWKEMIGEPLTFIAVSRVSTKWLGHNVIVSGTMVAGNSWGFEVESIH